MLKAYCDKCGEEMSLNDTLAQKIRIEIPWCSVRQDHFFLCKECEKSFCDWMGLSIEDILPPDEIPF